MQNIEVKIRCPHDESLLARLCQMNAELTWTRQQTDAFWDAPNGWLKLRQQIEDGHHLAAQLIGYRRIAADGVARPSDYHLAPVVDVEKLTSVLDATLGRIGEVKKTRELWMWRQTRIHLDDVADLGTFVELETVLQEIATPEGHQQLQDCLILLGLDAPESIGVPYLELLKCS